MSMVSLLIAPFIRDPQPTTDNPSYDWHNWYNGLAPLALFVLITAILTCNGTLGWSDPLAPLKRSRTAEQTQELTVPFNGGEEASGARGPTTSGQSFMV